MNALIFAAITLYLYFFLGSYMTTFVYLSIATITISVIVLGSFKSIVLSLNSDSSTASANRLHRRITTDSEAVLLWQTCIFSSILLLISLVWGFLYEFNFSIVFFDLWVISSLGQYISYFSNMYYKDLHKVFEENE